MKAGAFYLLALIFGVALFYISLSSPDPVDSAYFYSGWTSCAFLALAFLLSSFGRRVWARRFGLCALGFACLHCLNFVVLDKGFDFADMAFELGRNKFIWLGFGYFLPMAVAGYLSAKRYQRLSKVRTVLLYGALPFLGWHIFDSVKVAGFVQYFALGLILALVFLRCFRALLKFKRANTKKF